MHAKKLIEESGLYTIFHIPHDGCRFPEDLMSSVTVPYNEFLSYHNEMRDAGVIRFVPEIRQSEIIAFGISRLLCDVERFTDGTEVMDKFGMGYCYEKAYDGKVIKSSSAELKKRTYRYYAAHHKRMDNLIEQHPNGVLLVDLHSFSEKIIVSELKNNAAKIPDVCLGYDGEYCPKVLLSIARKCFTQAGLRVEINYPYSGSYVPNSVINGQTKTQIASIMVEVNKNLYMDNNTGKIDFAAAGKVKNAILEMIALYSQAEMI